MGEKHIEEKAQDVKSRTALRRDKLWPLIGILVLLVVINVVLRESMTDFSPFAVVRGNSMYPLLREGDIIIIERKDPSEIKIGDIVVYRSLRGGLIVHRVTEIIVVDETYYFKTKGDNNSLDDSFLNEYESGLGINENRILGVAVKLNGSTLKIPYIGSLVLLFS